MATIHFIPPLSLPAIMLLPILSSVHTSSHISCPLLCPESPLLRTYLPAHFLCLLLLPSSYLSFRIPILALCFTSELFFFSINVVIVTIHNTINNTTDAVIMLLIRYSILPAPISRTSFGGRLGGRR